MKINIFLLMVLSLTDICSKGQSVLPNSKAYSTAQPKIMVIPFTKEGEDIRTILEADFNRRIAVTKMKEAFDNRSFTTVDFSAKLKSALDDGIFISTSQSDIKSQLIELSGADIYVEVEVPEMIKTSSGNLARLILTGYDASTANSLSNKVCESPKFNTTDYGALVNRISMTQCFEEFLNTMQNKFSEVVVNGRSIKINFSIQQGSKYNLSTEIEPDGLPLSDILEMWMSDNSYKNSYHVQGTTSVRMLFDDVKIPLKDEADRNYNPNKFALKIFQFLKSRKIDSIKDIKNGTIFITIK
ncbi:MAG: DUF6175 family protein [Chitinophagaceae bacterium]|nr:DUF6175 family protein [Chitinophagaceae bacterium]